MPRGAQAQSDFHDEIGTELLTLTMTLETLRGAAAVEPSDPSLRSASASLRARLADVAALRDALEVVHNDMFDARMMVFTKADGPLADYLRGVYAWTKAIARAFKELARELVALAPDWSRFRNRLEDAEGFYLAPLETDIRAELEFLHRYLPELADARDPLHHVRVHVEEMFWSASGLRQALEQRFR
jgi:hypothetical protein